MALDRGVLAKIDRQIFAELGTVAMSQMVKIPLSDTAWSTWRRYCQAIGLTMGEAVAGLIDHELRMVVDELSDVDGPLYGTGRDEELAARESRLAAREIEERTRAQTQRLGEWERQLRLLQRDARNSDRRLATAAARALEPAGDRRKRGRNEPCYCGSGLKYKRCHGARSRQPEYPSILSWAWSVRVRLLPEVLKVLIAEVLPTVAGRCPLPAGSVDVLMGDHVGVEVHAVGRLRIDLHGDAAVLQASDEDLEPHRGLLGHFGFRLSALDLPVPPVLEQGEVLGIAFSLVLLEAARRVVPGSLPVLVALVEVERIVDFGALGNEAVGVVEEGLFVLLVGHLTVAQDRRLVVGGGRDLLSEEAWRVTSGTGLLGGYRHCAAR